MLRRLAGRLVRPRMRLAFVMLLAVWLAGCAAGLPRDARHRLSAFVPLAEDARVVHEPGAEAFAKRVAAELAGAIAQVEAAHYRRFLRVPRVHVCGTEACFHRLVARELNLTAAVVYDNRLVLAPRLHDREPHRLRPILVHELSHLHLGQRLGHYTAAIPIWFHEGLASLAADGGGADLVSDGEALAAVRSGRHFLPDEQHLPWTRKNAPAFGLPISLFYRQALLFLRHLRASEPERFRSLLDRLQDGVDFDQAFAESFHRNQANAARAFFAGGGCGHPDTTPVAAECPLAVAPQAQ